MNRMKTAVLVSLMTVACALHPQAVDRKPGSGMRIASHYKSIQAAHDALPATGGVIFVPAGTSLAQGLVISKPVHLIFDLGIFSYSGSGDAIHINSGVRGVIIEGSGGAEFNSPDSGSAIVVVDPAGKGLNAVANPSIVIRNIAFTGPGRGSGTGIYLTGNGFLLENTQTTSFGGDGTVIDGKRGNSNSGVLIRARSYRNGGDGFYTFGSDANLISWIGTDSLANGRKNYLFEDAMCQSFLGAHSQPSSDKNSIEFIDSSANWGSLYIEPVKPFKAACIEFDGKSKNNNLFLMNCRSVKDAGIHNRWELAAPDR